MRGGCVAIHDADSRALGVHAPVTSTRGCVSVCVCEGCGCVRGSAYEGVVCVSV